jgi:hypothetical protein
VALATAGGRVTAGEVWLEVPAMPRLALHGARPNPSPGTAVVAFSLPAAAPATLEMFDAAGRRVWSREVGSLGRGFHAVPLGGSRLPAGVYTIRLRQAAQSRASRLVVIP